MSLFWIDAGGAAEVGVANRSRVDYINQPLRRLLMRRSIEREAQENGAASNETTDTGI